MRTCFLKGTPNKRFEWDAPTAGFARSKGPRAVKGARLELLICLRLRYLHEPYRRIHHEAGRPVCRFRWRRAASAFFRGIPQLGAVVQWRPAAGHQVPGGARPDPRFSADRTLRGDVATAGRFRSASAPQRAGLSAAVAVFAAWSSVKDDE